MNFTIPKYIEIEDKIAFRLTFKQLGWFALVGAVLFLIWHFFNTTVFIVWAVLLIPLSLALSFWRPFGMTFPKMIGAGFLYLIRPKEFFWYKQDKKTESFIDNWGEKKEAKTERNKNKRELFRQVDNLADILDQGGDI